MGCANALRNLGQLQEALVAYREARAIYQRFAQELEVARCTMGGAKVLSAMGNFDESRSDFEKARAVFARFSQKSRAS
jgi:tetratricopeptide (TPR) repeat protein